MHEFITFLSSHSVLTAAIIVVLFSVMIVEFFRAKRSNFEVKPIQAIQLINHDNAVVIDIRSNEHYRKGHIINAYSMNAQDLNQSVKKLEKFWTRPILIVCGTGAESQKLAASLLKRGYNAYSISGGIRAWSEAQMPLIKE